MRQEASAIINIAVGDDVVDEINEAVRGQDAWIQAVGEVEDVELRLVGEGADPRRRVYGRHSLVSLMGPAGGPYMAMLSRVTQQGLELCGGKLLRARSVGVTLSVLPLSAPARLDTLEPEVEPDPAPVAVPQVAAGASNWAALAAQAAVEAGAEYGDSAPASADCFPEAGDLVQHFAFGLCDVLMAKGDSLRLRDVRGQGRIREVRLSVLRVLPPRDKDGKRLFKLARRE